MKKGPRLNPRAFLICSSQQWYAEAAANKISWLYSGLFVLRTKIERNHNVNNILYIVRDDRALKSQSGKHEQYNQCYDCFYLDKSRKVFNELHSMYPPFHYVITV